MKKYFACDFCDKKFDNESDCSEHEKTCIEKSTPVKAIHLDNFGNSCEYGVMIYNRALQKGGRISLMPHKYADECCQFVEISKFKFDKIKELEDGSIIIYTRNFDKEYEKLCLLNLIIHRQTKLRNDINYLNCLIKDLASLPN